MNKQKKLTEKSPCIKGTCICVPDTKVMKGTCICMTDTTVKDVTCLHPSFTQNITIVVLGFIAYSVAIIVSWYSLQKMT